MAFDSLSEKLQNVFKNLRSKGRLTEDDVKAALKEVKMALLEADVNFKVVKQFVKDVQERAIGQDVMNGLNPGQMVIKIVNEEMVKLMGSETTEIKLQPGKSLTVIMMEGLQGAGKTTTAAKLAGKFKLKGKKVLLTACDIYRPGAIEQLQINGEKQGVEVFSMGENHKPANIAKAAIEHAQKNGNDLVILDTAGRLHIDEDMMAELEEIKNTVTVHQTILVIDATEGVTEQDAKIAGIAHERGKGIIIAVNKWDDVEKDDKTIYEFTNKIKDTLAFMSYAEIIFVSAKTGQRLNKIYELVDHIVDAQTMRIPTGVLNEILTEAVAMKQPPSDKGKRLKIYYMTQVSVKPPTFVMFVNDVALTHFSYTRYIENRIRESFGFRGTSIRFINRERKEKE